MSIAYVIRAYEDMLNIDLILLIVLIVFSCVVGTKFLFLCVQLNQIICPVRRMFCFMFKDVRQWLIFSQEQND